MNNQLPTDQRFYVYTHIDPDEDGRVVYVGMGQRGRAWTFGNSGGEKAAYGHRSKEHFEWFLEKECFYCVSDLVSIYSDKMYKEEALREEKYAIEFYRPIFNKNQGESSLKISPDNYKICVDLRSEGLPYHLIAEEVGVSTMTVYRALNNQTKNIGEDYGS